MPKAGEIAYMKELGRYTGGVEHATHKPFSDHDRGGLLMRFGAMFFLLPPPPARILDIGCGTGWTSRFLANSGYSVVGVDICDDMIAVAEQQRGGPGMENLTFLVRDYEALDFRGEFDAAVFFDSLHHAEDERLALRKTYEALVPGGVCVTSEPGEGHAKNQHTRHAVEAFGVTEKDMPPHHIFRLGREAGFSTMRAFPLPESNLLVPYDTAPPSSKPWWRRIVGGTLRLMGFVVRSSAVLDHLEQYSAYCRLVK